MLTSVLTPHTPRLTASRNGFLARSTALSWPWNKDRILAAPGALPPSFADLALGLVDQTRPIIQMRCKDPLQREDDAGGTALPVVPAPARPQGTATQSAAEPEALDPRFREDDGGTCPTAGTAQNPMQRERTGPLRNGNPRGNPNLAPRCGARTRRTGCPCRAPAMRNGRCRLHGGKSTGPRTEEGRARIRAARTRHGRYSAEGRAFQRDISGLLRRNRELLALARQPGPLDHEALRHLLPPERGKNPLQREAVPLPRSVSRAPSGIHPVHPENRTPAPGGGTISARPRSSMAGPPPAAPLRRPILLARPKVHAP